MPSQVIDLNDRLVGLQVLVAEDNPVNQRLVLRMLEKLGCEITMCDDGQAAVDAIAQRRFDLVLMDCQMPVLDGYGAARAIRGLPEGHDIPIIALTANAMEGDRERCLAAGMDDYLSKPVRLKSLEAMIRQWRPGATSGASHASLAAPSLDPADG